jgi:hypothetical protein
VVLLEERQREWLADRAGLVARGHGESDLPPFREVQERFDARLSAEPEPVKQVDAEVLEFRRALGVA